MPSPKVVGMIEMDKEMDSVGASSYAHFHDAAFDNLFL